MLDEINLASSDTLQRLCGLLDEPTGSLTLTERGDDRAIVRHSNFRLFAAMNPATDAGKKDLPASIRSRFSELFVDELMDPVELRSVAAGYLDGVIPASGKPPEHSEIVISVVDIYLKCRGLAETSLSDGGGNKPRYTLRTLSRALSAAKVLVVEQRIPLHRAIYEGFQLAFEGALDATSTKSTRKLLKSLLGSNVSKSDLEHPGRRPEGRQGDGKYILIKPFWIKSGTLEPTDWSSPSADGTVRFILTPSISSSLRRLSRSLAAGPWPILLEGPTSAGKTTLVEYVAARCGHRVIRINNHEHTGKGTNKRTNNEKMISSLPCEMQNSQPNFSFHAAFASYQKILCMYIFQMSRNTQDRLWLTKMVHCHSAMVFLFVPYGRGTGSYWMN